MGILLITLFSCDSGRISKNRQIYNEYMLLGNNSWRFVRNKNRISIYDLRVGDTAILNPGIGFIAIDEEEEDLVPLSSDYYRRVDEPTTIRIVRKEDQYFRDLYHFEVLDIDTAFYGVATTEDMIRNGSDDEDVIRKYRNQLTTIQEEIQTYDLRLEDLASKYDLTLDSLFKVLAKEHYEVTGEPILGH